MKMINLERLFMIVGVVTSAITVAEKASEGFNAYAWPLAACMWIITCWIKTERLQSLTKNK